MSFGIACVCLLLILANEGRNSAAESISSQKCKEYSKFFAEGTGNICNERNTREVVNGPVFAESGEFPHMAALKFNNSVYLCTGALVSKNYVIAPAYCANSPDYGPPTHVLLGQLTTEKLDTDGQEIAIIETTVHPEFKPRPKTNVLSLLKLEKDAVFSKNVHPICLHEGDLKVDKLMASGWDFRGAAMNGDEKVAILKSTYTVPSKEMCKKFYTSGRLNVTDEQMCAGNIQTKSCVSTPAGTIQIANDNPCMDSLVGIVNYGRSHCMTIPDVYTRIQPYVAWIESIVWG